MSVHTHNRKDNVADCGLGRATSHTKLSEIQISEALDDAISQIDAERLEHLIGGSKEAYFNGSNDDGKGTVDAVSFLCQLDY